MNDLALVDVDDMLAAARQVEDLHQVAVVLARHGVSVAAVNARIDRLETAPVDVRCYVCCRGRVTVHGLARTRRPVCESCQRAACDASYCFVPAVVAFTTRTGHGVWCAEHGHRAFASGQVTVIRHLVGGEQARAVVDRRLTLAKAS